MNKTMDKLKEKAISHKRTLLFLIGISFIGLVFGSVFITILSKQDQSLVKSYIENFIQNIQNGKLNYLDALKNTWISDFSFISTIWLLGISIIGIPIILFMYFTKSFMIGFSVAAFVAKYQLKGLIYAIVYIFPHHLIHLIVLTLLTLYAIRFSRYLLNSIIKKKTIHLKTLMNSYLKILFIVAITVFLTALYETFAVPYFLKQVLHLIH